jgi:NADPH-dependent 2,4-dienoyl-CoA reductase/sulfur reductase-like enzyme/rhodanese-related sulfurtransferase
MSQNVLIIGAVALGPKVACRVKRLDPDANVVMIDQGDLISYGGCGIPYFISGDVSSADELRSTSFHMLRDVRFFKECKGVNVLLNTKATEIDRNKKIVIAEDLKSGERKELPYDKLVIATGSTPKKLDIIGAELPGIYTISGLDKAINIRNEIASGKVGKAVVIGAGAIGLEIAEALSDMWGIETCVVEVMDQILPGIISYDMAKMAQHHMEEHGIRFYLSEKAIRFEGKDRVQKVVTDKREIETDIVIVAIGVEPNTELAKRAGIELSPSGGIIVNEYMQTSDPDIYAGGDCVCIKNLITGRLGYFPLGSLANRQGRVIGTNIVGGKERFEGAVGSFVIKLFDIAVASAGLSVQTAKKEGFDCFSAFVAQFDRAHFYPEKEMMFLELVVENGTGRVLGIQGLGKSRDAVMGRVGAVAGILKYKPHVSEISNFELPYSPPFSSAMDILNAVANVAENILQGRAQMIDLKSFAEWWTNRDKEEILFLDCREWGNAGVYVEKYPQVWKNIPQGQLKKRISEVPKDKKIVLICNTGVRSYEAQLILKNHGYDNTWNLQGGMAAVKDWGLDI